MLKNKTNFRGKKAFGSVASTLIMFIAIISVTTGLVIAFQNYFVKTQDALKYQQDETDEKLRTIFEITHTYYDSGGKSLSIFVKNTGGTNIVTKYLDVYVDSQYGTNLTPYYAENDTVEVSLLKPQETAKLKFDIDLAVGSHKTVVVTEHGVSVSEMFNVE